MFGMLGALVALVIVFAITYGATRYAAGIAARKAQEMAQQQRIQALRLIEDELEELEAKSKNRTREDDEVYHRLIRRRNALVTA